MKAARKSKPVGVLSKTFQIVELIRNAPKPLVLKDISEQSGINKSTALRILAHLESARYVTRNRRGEYALGNSSPHGGGAATLHEVLRRAARPQLWELWHYTQETVNLAVMDGAEVVYLDCLESSHDFRLVALIGMRAVAYRTALGKAMLAFLPPERRDPVLGALAFTPFTPNTIASVECFREELGRVREQGYAVDNEESHLGLRCLAAPILNGREEAVAAVSISGPVGRVTVENVPVFGARVRVAANAISLRLQSSGLE